MNDNFALIHLSLNRTRTVNYIVKIFHLNEALDYSNSFNVLD